MQGRRDWVQAEVRCLLCGRSVGDLYGPADRALAAGTSSRLGGFVAFRPADPSAPLLRSLRGGFNIRCSACGGGVMLDEVRTFSTYDETVVDDEVTDRPRRGRPPKPWRRVVDTRLAELGLAG